MTLRFTPRGERQYFAALAYIMADQPKAARRFHMRAFKALHHLEKHPELGRHIPEFPDLPHREVIVRPYRFFYRVAGQTVWVVGVWHSAQLVVEPEER